MRLHEHHYGDFRCHDKETKKLRQDVEHEGLGLWRLQRGSSKNIGHWLCIGSHRCKRNYRPGFCIKLYCHIIQINSSLKIIYDDPPNTGGGLEQRYQIPPTVVASRVNIKSLFISFRT